MNQNYESELMPTEYVIRGNSAILKCNVPSFVADFIIVEAWETSEGQTYTRDSVESKQILKSRKIEKIKGLSVFNNPFDPEKIEFSFAIVLTT